MREYTGPNRQATAVTFVPGNPPRLAAVVGGCGYLWRPDRPEPDVLTWPEPPASSEPLLSASRDGRWLVAGPNTLLHLWDLSAKVPSGHPYPNFPGLVDARLVPVSDRLTVVLVLRTGRSVEVHAGGVEVPHPGSRRPHIRVPPLLMAANLLARLERMSPSDWRLQSALSADGARLAVAPRELPGDPLAREVFLWDIGTNQPPRTLATSGHPCGLSFSPDGSKLVVDVGTIYAYDSTTLELVGNWKAKYDYAPGLAWSPDGKLLARTDNSTTVRIYEVATGREVLAVGGKRGRLVCAAFSPDGLTLATGTHLGPIRVWDVE